MKLSSVIKKSALKEWSHQHILTSEGLFGLDTSEHTNDGYKLVKVPNDILRSLVSSGLTKKVKSIHLYPNSGWAISFDNGAFDVRSGDFKNFIQSGLSGVRVDKDKTLVYFKV